ncbi:MAG: thiamine-phosphate kinase, partial [Chthoniobacterales bacterium]
GLQLLKTDCVIEGVHFRAEDEAERVGWKAVARAISDVAACGGTPDSCLVTVAVPGDRAVEWLDGLYRGIAEVAGEFDVAIVGGETARSREGAFVSVAMTGCVEAERLVLRSGARVGDQLFVTGRLGGSFESGRHLDFRPRVAEAGWLTERFEIRAMMDLSDGLGSDLPRLASASGVGFRVDLDRIPLHPGCSVEQGISDGEDYELLFAVSAEDALRMESEWEARSGEVALTRIGNFVVSADGENLVGGWRHFG